MARLKVKQISDFNSAVSGMISTDNLNDASAISSALSAGVSAGVNADGVQSNLTAEINATNSDVDSIDLVLTGVASGTEVTSLDTYIDDVSADLLAEIGATNADFTSVNLRVSNDEAALAAEISATSADVLSIDSKLASVGTAANVTSLDTYADGISSDLAAEILATGNEVISLDSYIDGVSGDVGTNSTSISAILAGADVNMDNFAEVVSYINSVDDASDLDLVNELSSIDTRIGLDEAALSAEISATNADVTSLDTYADGISSDLAAEILATGNEVTSLDTYADGISSDLAAEILATGNEVISIDTRFGTMGTSTQVTSLDTYIDGVSSDLAAEINATNADVTSLDTYIDAVSADLDVAEADIASLQGQTAYIKQGGLPTSTTSFRVLAPVRYANGDDLLVFVNGLEVHEIEMAVQTGEEFGSAPTITMEGYSTTDGQSFTMANLGYPLEANDHIHVVGVRA